MRSVRVYFKKLGNTKYISHLDLNRFMIRMVRLSGIPVWYSEGFNPHPYITFALPLSLGFESTYEMMDIRLDDDSFSNQAVFDALSVLMPEGIEITDCKDPVMKSGEIAFASYDVIFDVADTELQSKLPEYLSRESITAQKKTKKGGIKTLNIKEYVDGFELDNDRLSLMLSAGGSNNLNPKLLLDTFTADTGIVLPYYKIVRTGLYNSNREIFK